jgi:hypothetical protein
MIVRRSLTDPASNVGGSFVTLTVYNMLGQE